MWPSALIRGVERLQHLVVDDDRPDVVAVQVRLVDGDAGVDDADQLPGSDGGVAEVADVDHAAVAAGPRVLVRAAVLGLVR